MMNATNIAADPVLPVRPIRREGLECHFLEGEAILYDFAHHALHYLNATAYEIWRNCDGNTPLDELLAKVAATFDSKNGHDQATVDADLRDALQNLVEHGLIECGRK